MAENTGFFKKPNQTGQEKDLSVDELREADRNVTGLRDLVKKMANTTKGDAQLLEEVAGDLGKLSEMINNAPGLAATASKAAAPGVSGPGGSSTPTPGNEEN